MAKLKSFFVCTECSYESVKWYGKCPSCNIFNCMVEDVRSDEKSSVKLAPSSNFKLINLSEDNSDTQEVRVSTKIEELDRVFGGGIVKGSVTLLGGDPGIGKSTLLLQVCDKQHDSQKVLYVSGEESHRQIKMRAQRLSLSTQDILLLTSAALEDILLAIERENPDLVIIDSVQTLYSKELGSLPGTVTQIRECATTLTNLAKSKEISFVFIGHITKEGTLAGPKLLEHMVDTVLYFEGDKNLTYRIIRSIKNRFGSTNEIGIFEMGEKGLTQVENPSAALLSGKPKNVAGTCTVCIMEGTRPILAEVQALLIESKFGSPRRAATGIESNRLSMLLAVLEKRGGLRLSDFDAYVNVIGGLRLTEPSFDISLILAAASSYLDKPVSDDLIAFGEVGLVGELRSVHFATERIREALRLGYTKFIIPYSSRPKEKIDGATIYAVKTIAEAIEIAI